MALSFLNDINKGKVGENIFKEDFLAFLDIDYEDVTNCQQFQVIDSDFKAKIGLYEIKANYNDDGQIIIEDYTNINENLCKLSLGWWHKTKADLIVFVSKKTRNMILLPMNDNIKTHYENIKNQYPLIRNKITEHNGRRWQSAFRRIDLKSLNGYYAKYKKIQ